MRRSGRLIAALAVAAMCAPGTWLRSEIDASVWTDITVSRIAGAAATPAPQWAVAGVWQYRATGLQFGGFSAMLTLGPGTLRAFTDRGFRMTFTEPDRPAPTMRMNRQQVSHGWEDDLTDIESATRDPASGDYWLGYEHVHAIQRNTVASSPAGLRDLSDEVDWPANAGNEAMARLTDGRFVVMPEDGDEGLIFASDPVDGGAPATFRFRTPANGYVATDMTQLPDGRLLLLMRNLVRPSRQTWPPFSTLLAIGDAPSAGGEFAPAITLRLGGVIPRENYEGLAVRPRDDGRIDVWVISDDNFSVFQRTLLAKLVFDPQATATR